MKYTPQQLEAKARCALKAKDAGDPRWLELMLKLSVHLGVSPAVIEARIRRLAH